VLCGGDSGFIRSGNAGSAVEQQNHTLTAR
jgi:hypothetical protein